VKHIRSSVVLLLAPKGARIPNITKTKTEKKTQDVLYFRKTDALRISNIIRESSENRQRIKYQKVIRELSELFLMSKHLQIENQ